MRIVLWQPLIAANTGNIGRLCLAVGAELVLVGRLGFSLSDKAVRRAGVDHWPYVRYRQVLTLADAVGDLPRSAVFLFEAGLSVNFWQAPFATAWPGPALVFGNENPGLPTEMLSAWADRAFSIPMPGCGAGAVRSLNLANAVAVAAYEVLRQRRSGAKSATG